MLIYVVETCSRKALRRYHKALKTVGDEYTLLCCFTICRSILSLAICLLACCHWAIVCQNMFVYKHTHVVLFTVPICKSTILQTRSRFKLSLLYTLKSRGFKFVWAPVVALPNLHLPSPTSSAYRRTGKFGGSKDVPRMQSYVTHHKTPLKYTNQSWYNQSKKHVPT